MALTLYLTHKFLQNVGSIDEFKIRHIGTSAKGGKRERKEAVTIPKQLFLLYEFFEEDNSLQQIYAAVLLVCCILVRHCLVLQNIPAGQMYLVGKFQL